MAPLLHIRETTRGDVPSEKPAFYLFLLTCTGKYGKFRAGKKSINPTNKVTPCPQESLLNASGPPLTHCN